MSEETTKPCPVCGKEEYELLMECSQNMCSKCAIPVFAYAEKNFGESCDWEDYTEEQQAELIQFIKKRGE